MLRKEDFEPNMETEDKIPGAQTENPAQSQRFGDFIVKYMQNVQDTMELFPGASFRAINEIFGVLYVPLESMGEIEVTGTSYNSIPKCYTYMDMEAAGESGINRLHDHPYLKLRGKGTAVAVIDSGIDYQNEVFRNAGGSRIAYLWDQSIEEEEQNQSGRELEAENGDADNLPGDDIADTEVPYGKLFRKKDIDRALASEEPFAIVPSSRSYLLSAKKAYPVSPKYGTRRKFYRSSAGGNPDHHQGKAGKAISPEFLSLSSGCRSFSGK